ncbi:MAG TPA: TetR family transcriptional regulator [Mycobacteriales bacterium]|nr:TetR family transcriptional regulator [Mycobacteriales bacterium]
MAERPARARNAEATRDDLLHAAMRRFTVLGYERTTTRDVAADAGVNVSLINRYFGSKDGLFAAVMGEFAQSLEAFRASRTSLVGSMLDQLDLDAWPEFGREHPLLLLLRDIGADERVGELRRRTLHEVVARLAVELGAGRSEPAQDATLRAEFVLALVAGVLTLRAALPDGELATGGADRLRDALHRATTAVSTSLP